MITRILSFSALGLLLAACSTATVGQTQEVTVLTPGAMDVECRLWNADISYNVGTDETLRIMKSGKDLQVDCYAPGNREQSLTLSPSIEAVTAANAFNGFFPGLVIDHSSRAMYRYPDEIIVSFRGVHSQPSRLPKYHNPDVVNPAFPALPHMGPTVPMVESDKGVAGVSLHKKTAEDYVSSNPFLEYTEPSSGSSGAHSSAVEVNSIGDVIAPAPSFAPPSSSSPSSDAEGLTRSMNPGIFGN